MSRASRAVGTRLRVEATPPYFIAGLTNVDTPDLAQEELEDTTLDSDGGYRTYVPGFKDPGSAPLEGFYYAEPESGQRNLYDLYESGEAIDFATIFPDHLQTVWKYSGFISAFKIGGMEVDGLIPFTATVRISGKPQLLQGADAAPYYIGGTSGTIAALAAKTPPRKDD
ncbi:MAG: hypothetical protein FWB71_05040 [Defluviitaleaceae bacterium]|nr:hypothetical protein [Defluviitaleaceae bacterium]